MIGNESELNQSIEQLERMYRALAELRARVPPINHEKFQVMAEGPVEEIRRLQADIEAYLGVRVTVHGA